MDQEKLKEYYQKRDLNISPEPKGDLSISSDGSIFVIQKHRASTLHYDFRLESEGVLKSWVIPKGPSTDPREKRLAIPTEDHPIEYARFEGVIPEGQYGAGKVIVWDSGTYENTSEKDGTKLSFEEAIEEGHITVDLKGEKIQGGYALIRTGSGDDTRWLLVKMDDDHADARRNPTSTEPESVISGKRIEDIREDDHDE